MLDDWAKEINLMKRQTIFSMAVHFRYFFGLIGNQSASIAYRLSRTSKIVSVHGDELSV